MGTLTDATFNHLYSIIRDYTADGSKISIDELSELSGFAIGTIKNHNPELMRRFPNLRKSIKPTMFWVDSSAPEEQITVAPKTATCARFIKSGSALEEIIKYIEEHSKNGEKISSSEIINALSITRHTFWNVSSEISRRNPKIKSEGGHGGAEKSYWIEKEEEVDPEITNMIKEMVENPQITPDDVPMVVGEIWTDKSGYDAKGFDRRKFVIIAIAGHTAYALEIRTSEDGFRKEMGDIWVGKAGIGYLAPRLIFQKSTSSLDQFAGICPADVMEKIRERLRILFGIKPQIVEKEVEKIVEKEVPVEVEKIVEKEVKVEVPVPNGGDISEIELALLRQKVEIYENIINAFIRKEVV